MSERSYLEEISIRNLGIIDQSELELGRGLNVLTGETGAGKTMILTALSLVLGGKSDSALVRHGSDRLVASATFSVPKSLHSDLEEVGAGNILILPRHFGVPLHVRHLPTHEGPHVFPVLLVSGLHQRGLFANPQRKHPLQRVGRVALRPDLRIPADHLADLLIRTHLRHDRNWRGPCLQIIIRG